jgi:hypothetical protein
MNGSVRFDRNRRITFPTDFLLGSADNVVNSHTFHHDESAQEKFSCARTITEQKLATDTQLKTDHILNNIKYVEGEAMAFRIYLHKLLRIMAIIVSYPTIGAAFVSSNWPSRTRAITSRVNSVSTFGWRHDLSRMNTCQVSMLPKLFQDLFESTNDGSSTSNTKSILNTNNPLGGIIPVAFLSTAFAPAAFGLTGTTAVVAGSDANVEVQLLNDMSHLGIDLAGFFIPGVLALRIAAIAGRICTMAADYIPDHTIVPEELAFQIAMLTVACLGLIKAALLPAAASAYNGPSVSAKDGRAYTVLFQPAGMSWSHYKALTVCGALDWIKLSAGDTVTTTTPSTAPAPANDDEYTYWLYSGDVRIESGAGDPHYTISRCKKVSSQVQLAGRGLFGEHRLLQRSGNTKVKSNKPQQYDAEGNTVEPQTSENRISVTSDSATLLRIHTSRLQWLMDHDPTLAESMRTLVFQGMEAKLHAQVQETTHLLKSFNMSATSIVV